MRARPERWMVERARELRRAAVFPERLLWSRLCKRRCGGLRFRRQQAIGPYVVDFFCMEAGVVVELDGRCHAIKEAADRGREQYLSAQGLRVVRFTNGQVLRDVDAVAEEIRGVCGGGAGVGAPGVRRSPLSPRSADSSPVGER